MDIEHVPKRGSAKTGDRGPLVEGVRHDVDGMRRLHKLPNGDEMTSRDSTKLL